MSELQEGDYRAQRANPKQEHPADKPGLHGAEQGMELRSELSEPLRQLRVETTEVSLKQVPEFRAICGVHLIEPLHEFVRQLVAKFFVELAGQSRRHRHRDLLDDPVTLSPYARRSGESIHRVAHHSTANRQRRASRQRRAPRGPRPVSAW